MKILLDDPLNKMSGSMTMNRDLIAAVTAMGMGVGPAETERADDVVDEGIDPS